METILAEIYTPVPLHIVQDNGELITTLPSQMIFKLTDLLISSILGMKLSHFRGIIWVCGYGSDLKESIAPEYQWRSNETKGCRSRG